MYKNLTLTDLSSLECTTNTTFFNDVDKFSLINWETVECIVDATTSWGNPKYPVPIAGMAMD